MLTLIVITLISVNASAQSGRARFLTHSHNDYASKNPLMEALFLRFDSVEADVWLVGKRVMVSHMGFVFRGSLKELYLDPLQKIVNEKGSVHGDRKTFLLWLDIKSDKTEIASSIHELLSLYPMISTFSDHGSGKLSEPGPVMVILTGNQKIKDDYVSKYTERKACRDSNAYDFRDPVGDSRWSWYSLKWSNYFKWTGSEKMPEVERSFLKTIVLSIHEKKRKVRFWGAPETPEFWKIAEEMGIDAVGTDHRARLSGFVNTSTINHSLAAE
jgi:hypothetical protein